MKHESTISAKSGRVSYKNFLGINRRLKTDGGEFSDMENMSHREYPCICSEKGYKDAEIYIPKNALMKKLVIPRRSTSDFARFTGVAIHNNETALFINGTRRRTLGSFTDALDYNGAIITLPEFSGFTYAMKTSSGISEANIIPYSLSWDMYCYTEYTSNSAKDFITSLKLIGCDSTWYTASFSKMFKEGDRIELAGFEDNMASCNTIYPSSSVDYSNTTSPVSIVIKSYSVAGSASSGVVTIVVEIKNAKGDIIPWPATAENALGAQYAIIKEYVPKVTYGCVAHNRIWCCSENGEEVYASALGKPYKFCEFSGVSTDSWSVSVGTPGHFTGIAPWQTRVLVFKEECIQVIYGTTPKEFGIERTYNPGCIDRNSIANAGGMLIWLSYDGFYAYGGGKPEKISDKLNTKYISAVSFSDGVNYYTRCEKENGEKEFLVFDTKKGIWNKLSDLDIVSGDFYKGKLYVYTQDSVYIVKDGEYGDFYFETPELTFETFSNKSLIYLTIRCKINSGFINFYNSVNGGEWIPHKGISVTGKHKIPIRYSPGDILRFRVEGNGDVIITEMEFEMLVKERS